MTLPAGFQVRIRDDVELLDGGRLLVGGSPLRLMRLSRAALARLEHNRLRVTDRPSARLAERLLDANVADPVLSGPAVSPSSLTVVIPARDRTEQLDRTLAALRPTLNCLVVDDASDDPDAMRKLAEYHGAELIALSRNVGPAGARNAGLRHVGTPYVAFVDSDVAVAPETLLALARHFDDPRVAVVGPHVRGAARSVSPQWFERYDEVASSLALGTRPCAVRPGSAVGWVPSACLVGRVPALGDGFDTGLRVGEDVDLVWRLIGAGWVVRYDPAYEAAHEARTTVGSWLARKFIYGTGSAMLARRHGAATAPAILSPSLALAAAAILVRRRWSWPVALASATWTVRTLGPTLAAVSDRRSLAIRLSARGLGWAVRQESALLVRHWWPPAVVAATMSSTVRRAMVSALAVDAVVAATQHRATDPATNPATDPIVNPAINPAINSAINPVARLVGRRLDDLAYGAGLWAGAIRARSLRCLAIRWTRSGTGTATRWTTPS